MKNSTGNIFAGSKKITCLQNTLAKRGEQKTANKFPHKIMDILSHKEFQNIITWLEDGTFVILDKSSFQKVVLPMYFLKDTKYSAFERKARRWGFQISKIGRKITFSNELFKSGRLDMMKSNSYISFHQPKRKPSIKLRSCNPPERASVQQHMVPTDQPDVFGLSPDQRNQASTTDTTITTKMIYWPFVSRRFRNLINDYVSLCQESNVNKSKACRIPLEMPEQLRDAVNTTAKVTSTQENGSMDVAMYFRTREIMWYAFTAALR